MIEHKGAHARRFAWSVFNYCGPVTAAGQVCYIPTQIIYKLPDDANTHNVHALYFWPISKIKQHEKFVKQPLVLSLCDQAELLQRETQMTFL